jgi:hypothetical protein
MRASAVRSPTDIAPPIFAQSNFIAPAEIAPPPPEPLRLPPPEKWNPRIAALVEEWQWKLSIVAPALVQPKNSRARGTMLNDLAGKTHTDRAGNPVRIALRTLRSWIAEVESDGPPAMVRKQRADSGQRRYRVSGTWDNACPLPAAEKTRIAGEIETYVKRLWESNAPGVNRILQLATSKLEEISRAAGWADANKENCTVGRYLVERHRGSSLIAIKENDAKRYADDYIPRIQRSRRHLKPMDRVVGDVHPIDVQKTHDGRVVHARLIAWEDLATADIHVSVVLLDKGMGVRQEHIARAFVAMVMEWGLPRSLYLDNGSEYKWEEMIEGFRALAGLTNAFDAFIKDASEIREIRGDDDETNAVPAPELQAVSRALPYHPSSKSIEGKFGILERSFFPMMEGFVGGDRMKKHTHKVGSAPRSYEGTEEEFKRDIETCLRLYRDTAQRGGSSPNDKRRAFYAEGWRPYTAKREVFLFAFSEVVRRKVHTGGIQVDNVWGSADVLIPLVGQTVDIRVAKWDRSHTFYVDATGKLHAIPMGVTFDHGDPEGAKEQARRNGVLSAHLREIATDTPRLHLLKEAERHLQSLPAPPSLPEGIEITTADSDAITNAMAVSTAPPPRALRPGEQRHPTTGAVFGLSPPKEERSHDAPTSWDPLKSLLSAPDQKEKPNPEEPAFDLFKNLSTTPRKAAP